MVKRTTSTAGASASRRATFDAVYAQHLDTIVRYLRRRLGDEAAEDAAAEVFLRALRATRPLDGPDEALPWLYATATHVISERHRAERRRLRAMERAAGQLASPTVEAEARGAVDPALMAALRRLPATDREALLLVAWGELSYDEAARVLQVPIGTVRSRIARARRRLDGAGGRRQQQTPAHLGAGDR